MPKTTAKKKKPAAPTLATALTKRPDVKEKLELVNDSGRAVLVQEFSPFYVGAVPLIERGKAIKIKSVEDVSQMQEAREIRLELRQLRIAADKTRKRLKDESLRVGNAVQGMYNILMLDVEPMEKKLLDDEQHIERLEAERKRQLVDKRTALLAPYKVDPEMYRLDELSDEAFQKILQDCETVRQQEIKAEKAAEKEKAEREKKAKRLNQRKDVLLELGLIKGEDEDGTFYAHRLFNEPLITMLQIVTLTDSKFIETITILKKKIETAEANENERLKIERLKSERLSNLIEYGFQMQEGKFCCHGVCIEEADLTTISNEKFEKVIMKGYAAFQKHKKAEKEQEEMLARVAAQEEQDRKAAKERELAPDKEKLQEIADNYMEGLGVNLETDEAKSIYQRFVKAVGDAVSQLKQDLVQL